MVTVSVLMPVFNGKKYVASAICSILNQSFREFEFIVINDGSTDGSAEMLKAFAAKDDRIHLVSRENRGLIASLNEGLALGRAPLIARMDADDISHADRFAHQVAFLRDHQQVVCVGGAVEMMDEKGRYLTRLFMPESDHDIQQAHLEGHTAICHSSAMMRRQALIEVGGYDKNFPFAEDLDLWLRLGEVGQLANLRETVLRYRLHSGSMSERNLEQQRAVQFKACERAWKRRGINGKFVATEPWRPGTDPDSRLKFMLRYGWWAFNSGERWTAIIYGLRAVRASLLRREGWILLACALLKPLGKRRSAVP